MMRRRALASLLASSALLASPAIAQLVNPGAPTLAQRDGLIGPTWSPLDLGPSLLAWWDAERSDLITRDGSGLVSSWKDVVGGYDLTQAIGTAQPVWNQTSFNGRPGVAPDGVDDYLELSTGTSWVPAGAAPSEDWYLVDQPSPAADGLLWALGSWGASSNANSRTVFRQVAGGVNRATGNVAVGANNLLADFSGRHVIRLATSATGFIIEVDGLAPAETATVPATLATRLRMFANSNVTPASFGKAITAARLVTGALTTPQANNLRAFLTGRI